MGGGETSGAASWRPLPAVAICKISDALFLSGLLLFAQATQRECDADDYRHDIRRTNSLQKILNVAKEAESAVEDLFKRPETLQQTADLLTKLFPLWIFGAVMLGLFAPKTVTWLQGDGVTICVGATMVFTGMTLDTDDFVRILQQPSQVAMGVMCQYTVMPLAGCVIARVLQLQSDVAAGLILLASCPGGTSSNLITIIAKGDVALSVLMTTASTLLASFATPLLVAFMAGSLVRIDSLGLIKSTLAVVLGPVAVGLSVNKVFPNASSFAKRATPLLSVMMVSLICGSIIGHSGGEIKSKQGLQVLVAVILVHGLGFVVGYHLPRSMGISKRACRTTAIEVGIQSSALAVVLAQRHFPQPMLTSLSGAISSPVQSVLGSLAAMYWYANA